jgi:hypothetical protein
MRTLTGNATEDEEHEQGSNDTCAEDISACTEKLAGIWLHER